MSLLMCPAMIFPVIINEQTLVNKNSSQPDDHLLTPENLIKPLVVSQQPLLTRLSKDYKSQTDCSSSSSPISNVGNEIGVSNYHPASDYLASSQYKLWNDYDQADLDTFDEIEAQYALQLTQSNSQSVQSQKSNQTPQSSGLNLDSSSQETLPLKPNQGPFPHSSISHSNLDLSLRSSAVTGA
ncbi:hypothetical protein PPACK8108_LOCUS16707 [Phakopsora pachyrhizi]|uniref:Uncharacterized protein n=1 Tax=Phakopsora pachyrhizi TaxID=170000 RepID=A0AAV0B874_PHAPC|nr:hypothetical protein PPACK8108_LOCUS16707 [Phakopsora pachyrhizi]